MFGARLAELPDEQFLDLLGIVIENTDTPRNTKTMHQLQKMYNYLRHGEESSFVMEFFSHEEMLELYEKATFIANLFRETVTRYEAALAAGATSSQGV
jgi:hypothetical protein